MNAAWLPLTTLATSLFAAVIIFVARRGSTCPHVHQLTGGGR